MNLFSLGGFWSNIWMDIWISLNAMVYQLIEWLYEVFEVIANVNLFSREAFDDITGRLYVVIGIAMLFIFAYNIILMIINPEDKKNIGNTGKIVKETITALVLIILLPMIFNYMAIFQRNILDSHILEQIILGSTAGTGVECDFSDMSLIDNYVKVNGNSAIQEMTNECNEYKRMSVSKQGAYSVAPTLFTAFFHPKYYSYDECVSYLKECNGNGTGCNSSDGKITKDDDKELCAYYVYSSNIGQFKGGIMPFTENDIFAKAWSDKGIFDFNYLMALIAGCLGVWMFVCYSMAIGVRVAKLGFLQIISPIPVMLRMIPKQKEKIYDKWFKHLMNTYLDVFIRLAIIYFCLFAISLVPDVMKSLFSSLEGDWFGTKALAAVIVILGILQFAQEAPALIKEFFGGAGSFALKSPKKQLSDNKLAMAGMGMARSGFGAASRNMFKSRREGKGFWETAGSTIGGLFGGARRGAITGYGSTMDSLGRNSDRAIEETTEKRTERARYKALHPGKFGVIKGHINDGLNSANSWIGRDAGRDILDSIAYEEDVIKHYADYETMYKSGGYDAMDARLKEMKAAASAGGSYDGMTGGTLKTAITNLEKEMRKKRVEAIAKNAQNAGYVAYEFAQSLFADEAEFKRIKENLKSKGMSNTEFEAFVDNLKGLDIKNINGKATVVDKDGNVIDVSEDASGNYSGLIIDLLEGAAPEQGLNGASGKLKGQLSADKLSVAYKHQTKLEQERKDKDSKK